jgi:hypothetical protein
MHWLHPTRRLKNISCLIRKLLEKSRKCTRRIRQNIIFPTPSYADNTCITYCSHILTRSMHPPITTNKKKKTKPSLSHRPRHCRPIKVKVLHHLKNTLKLDLSLIFSDICFLVFFSSLFLTLACNQYDVSNMFSMWDA